MLAELLFTTSPSLQRTYRWHLIVKCCGVHTSRCVSSPCVLSFSFESFGSLDSFDSATSFFFLRGGFFFGMPLFAEDEEEEDEEPPKRLPPELEPELERERPKEECGEEGERAPV